MAIEESVMKVNKCLYRVACGCGCKDCDMTLELEKTEGLDSEIFLNMYKDLHWASYWDPNKTWYGRIWERIKVAARILFIGRIKVEECFVMEKSQIEAFIKAIEDAKKDIKEY